MTARHVAWLSPSEYLAQERVAETTNEYVDGTLFAMPPVTRAHVLITVNVTSELSQQLRRQPSQVYAQAMRVRIAEGRMYAYPDVVVVRGDSEFEDDGFDVLLNPTLIIEVLSDSTEGYDRSLKAARYRRRASLQEYVLVAQDRASVERYSRQGEQWVLTEAANLDDVMDLPSIGCILALRDIYDRIEVLSEAGLDDASGSAAPPGET